MNLQNSVFDEYKEILRWPEWKINLLIITCSQNVRNEFFEKKAEYEKDKQSETEVTIVEFTP